MAPYHQTLSPSERSHSCGFLRLLSLAVIVVFSGSATAAQVTLSNLAQAYSGDPKSVTVTTVPSGLGYTVTYNGSASPPTDAGSYALVATVVDPVETGSATGTLVISKAGQTITLSAFPAKTFGDEPFTAAASASSGLPVTKWESSDPSVASVSSSGLVTLVGAGQTSIIASNTGNLNFNATWVARPLNVARSLAPPPSGGQVVTYDGSARGLDPASLSSGQATEINYRETSVPEAPAVPEVVFQNGPDTLALSYLSTGVQATGTWGLAKFVELAGTARKLHSCEVTLVSWARYDSSATYGYQSWANAHPDLVVPPTPGISIPGNSGGYYHPVTLSFYEYVNQGVTETYRLLTTQTVQAFIPWRPATLADGVTAYATNGYAFRVPFSFPDGVILPPEVWVGVGFSASTHGTAPVGESGPYDSLNIARPEGQLVGTNLLALSLPYKDWRWQSSTGNTGPMLRLRAIPTNASPAAPVNAGSYEIKTQSAAFAAGSSSTSFLTIEKAPLEINLGNLTQIRDGTPKPVAVSSIPAGIATNVTYAGSPLAPSGLGSYPVVAVSANPNYAGQATGSLRIGDSFASWQTASFSDSGLPPDKTLDTADPDGDGLSNFLEYAFNLNPVSGDASSATAFEHGSTTLAFIYRRNLHALDLEYNLRDTSHLADPSSWALVTPLSETTVSDDGSTRIIRATVPEPTGQPSYFIRLEIGR